MQRYKQHKVEMLMLDGMTHEQALKILQPVTINSGRFVYALNGNMSRSGRNRKNLAVAVNKISHHGRAFIDDTHIYRATARFYGFRLP